MNRRFRLETVLRVRRLQVQQARGELALANGSVRTGQQLLADALTRVDLDNRQHVPAAGDGEQAGQRRSVVSGAEFVARSQQRMLLGADVVDARIALGQRQVEAAQALDEWSAARGREKGLELLEQRHREAVRDEDLRLQQRADDDLSGAMHRRRRRAGAA